MRRLNAILVLFTPVLLAGCQARGDAASAPAKSESTRAQARSGTSSPQARRESAGANEANRSLVIPRVLAPEIITVLEGATLPLVLQTAISSATSQTGDLVVARLAEDVRVGEKVAVPSGSEVRGRITSASPSGHVKGLARLAFDFDTLILNGREHSIDTKAIDITAKNTHKKDAATIGIGAGAGAIVGAIVDGKKGAGIGALIGGATGTGVVLTNTGKEVELGAGTRVTVVLTREARL